MIGRVFRRPQVYWFIGIFVLYLALNIILSGFYETIPLVIAYASAVNWIKLGISLTLTLGISFLVAIVSVLTYIKYKERKNCKKEMTLSSVGAVGGLVTGVCPLCITGLIPLILGVFGVSFSLASLPFQGIEIQVLVVIILVISLVNLSKYRNTI